MGVNVLCKLFLIGLISTYVLADSCLYDSDTKSIICTQATYSEIQHFLNKESKEYNHLTVNSSTLKKIDADLFGKRSHTKLQSIEFIRNTKLTKISKGAFEALVSIEKIVITENSISKLVTNTFKDLHSLKLLDLSQNKISSLEKNVFYNLTQLTNLLLNKNKISTLKNNHFYGLTNLDYLYISDTSLKTVRDSAFADLTNLRDLDLTNNRIKSLPGKVFQGLSNLERLNLSGNSIKKLGEDLFVELSNVTVLDVANNQISVIAEGGLKGLNKLTDLSLAANSFERFDTSLLIETPVIQTLDISGNNIELLNPEFLLKTAPTLREINLTDNEFSCSELVTILGYFDQKNMTYVRNCNNGSKFEICNSAANETPNVNGVYCNNSTLLADKNKIINPLITTMGH